MTIIDENGSYRFYISKKIGLLNYTVEGNKCNTYEEAKENGLNELKLINK